MTHCPDCGTRMTRGLCPNCHEELFILEYQSEDVEAVSPEFQEAADAQTEQIRLREEAK